MPGRDLGQVEGQDGGNSRSDVDEPWTAPDAAEDLVQQGSPPEEQPGKKALLPDHREQVAGQVAAPLRGDVEDESSHLWGRAFWKEETQTDLSCQPPERVASEATRGAAPVAGSSSTPARQAGALDLSYLTPCQQKEVKAIITGRPFWGEAKHHFYCGAFHQPEGNHSSEEEDVRDSRASPLCPPVHPPDHILALGVIERSSSEWCNSMVLLPSLSNYRGHLPSLTWRNPSARIQCSRVLILDSLWRSSPLQGLVWELCCSGGGRQPKTCFLHQSQTISTWHEVCSGDAGVPRGRVGTVDTLNYSLLGRDFLLETGHHALQWLGHMKDSNACVTRWYLSLQPYQFSIGYITGLVHRTA